MTKYDVTDETFLNFEPHKVFKALMDQSDGFMSWWRPHVVANKIEGPAFGQPGGKIHCKVNCFGWPQFTMEAVEIQEDRLIKAKYIDGSFVGVGTWTLKPENGGTRLSFRWQMDPNELMFKLSAPFISAPKLHSSVMKKGFEALSRYLETR